LHRLTLKTNGSGSFRQPCEAALLLSETTRHLEPDALVPRGIVCDDLAALIERLAAHEPGFGLAA
jgi:hypothetical protein